MAPNVSEETLVSFSTKDALHAAQSMIAVSSIMDAIVSEYANTGVLAVGALQHAASVVDDVIDRLGLAELGVEQASIPF